MVQNRWGDWKIFEAWLTYRVSGRFCFPSVQIGLKSTGRSVNYRVLLLPLTKDHCSSTKHLSDNLLSLLLCSDSIKKIFWNFSILLKPPIMAIFMFSNKENTLTDPCLTYTKLHVHVVNCYQCDQIGRFFALWATIQSQWQLIFYLNCPHC